ncbi:MAG: hypothetical protein JW748_03720 [Anaerolineales bacterium]|nr:hypothetical protein [Anaerolineales bacterium]
MGAGGTAAHLRFRPDPEPDGAFEQTEGAPIPVAAPDWDLALGLLRKLNSLTDVSGRSIPSILAEDGFEPWWYGQDRLLRFYLVPLTQLLPFLSTVDGHNGVRVEDAPPDLERVLRAIGGKEGFAGCAGGPPPKPKRSSGKWAMLALTLASLAVFRITRRDTLFYIIDHVSPGLRQDFRFTPLYHELKQSGFRFAEFAHTLSPRQAIVNFFRRRRPVFFLESADFLAQLTGACISAPAPELPPAGSLSVEDRALRALVPVAIDACAQSIARQRILKRALRFQRVRRAVIFDDNRHNFELIAACLALGIPVLGFQHGVFNKYHAGLMAYGFAGARPHTFDRYGVWSGLFRDRLLRDSALFTPERVFVAGPIRPPEVSTAVLEESRLPADPAARIRVLVVSEPLARKSEVAAYLRTLLQDPGFEIYLKLRPGESEKSLEEYSLPASGVRLLRTGTVYEACAQVDAAIGTYSSVLYEAALMSVPIVWMKTTRAYGRELADEGLVEKAERPGDLPQTIRRACALPAGELRRRRERIWGGEIQSGAVSLIHELRRMGGE